MEHETITLVCLVCGHRFEAERGVGAAACERCGAAGLLSTLYEEPAPALPEGGATGSRRRR